MTNGFAILPVSAVYVQHPTQNDTAEIGTSSLSKIDRSISWEMVTDPRVEAAVLAQDKKPPQNIPDAPKLFWDDDLGHCYIATNIPRELLQTIGISLEGSSIEEQIPSAPRFEDVYDKIQRIQSIVGANYQRTLLYDPVVVIWVKVPATWSTGENIEIKFKMFNEGHQTATVSCHFFGYDNSTGSDEVEFSVSGSVNINRQSYGYKTLTVEIPQETVGIKRGLATATGDTSYYEDMGYVFVQKFGELESSDLPEDDRTSYASSSDTYYWEGFPDIDGFNVPANYSMYHPSAWNITWIAGYLIDSYKDETINQIAEDMTQAIHQKITNGQEGEYFRSDFKIMDAGYVGVCRSYAILEISCLTAIGIPARQLRGYDLGTGGHSWVEHWNVAAASWIVCDPSLNKYDNSTQIKGFNYTYIKIYVNWDDSEDDMDGSSTDGLFGYGDICFGESYDGPVDYGCAIIDVCEDTILWTYDPSWPNPLYSIRSGTLYTSDGYLRANPDYSDGTGPFYYRELENPLDISDLRMLEVEVSFNNPEDKYKGCFGVALYDNDKELICFIKLYEWKGGEIDMDFHTRWYLQNGTWNGYSWLDYTGSPWRGIIKIYREDSNGMWSSIGGFGSQQLFSESAIQGDQRVIRYVGIQWRKGADTFLNYYLHDMRVREYIR